MSAIMSGAFPRTYYGLTSLTRKRKVPTLREIAERAAEIQCQHPSNCGDGRNGYDCAPCMAKAFLNARGSN